MFQRDNCGQPVERFNVAVAFLKSQDQSALTDQSSNARRDQIFGDHMFEHCRSLLKLTYWTEQSRSLEVLESIRAINLLLIAFSHSPRILLKVQFETGCA